MTQKHLDIKAHGKELQFDFEEAQTQPDKVDVYFAGMKKNRANAIKDALSRVSASAD